MPLHVEFALDDAQDPSIGPDDEGGSLAGKRTETPDTKSLGNLAVGVREQGKIEGVFFVEGFLPIHRISADPRALGTKFSKLGRQIAKVTAFDRSPRCHRLGIEKQDKWPRSKKLAQSNRVSILIGGNKVPHCIFGFHQDSPSLGPESARKHRKK